MLELSNQTLAALGGLIASTAVAVAATTSKSPSKARIPILSLAYLIGASLEFFTYFLQSGLPTTQNFFPRLLFGSSELLWILILSATSIAAQQSKIFLNLSGKAQTILFTISAISQATADVKTITSAVWMLLSLSTLVFAIATITGTYSKIASLWITLKSRFGLNSLWSRLATLVLVLIVVSIPMYLLSEHSAASFHNASPNSQVLPLEAQGRQGHASDSSFNSGVLPNGPDGESRLPTVLKFYGSASASNPNVKQVVRVWVKGTLDRGHIGNVTLVASGVPQPSGYLNLVNSRAVVALKVDHLLGLGKITLVDSRAVRGVVTFSRLGRFDFILTTIPSSYDHVTGSLTLINSQHGDKDSDADGTNLA